MNPETEVPAFITHTDRLWRDAQRRFRVGRLWLFANHTYDFPRVRLQRHATGRILVFRQRVVPTSSEGA